jgi:hypothetical protein
MPIEKQHLSPGARLIWDTLSGWEKRAVQKRNPFRAERDEVVRAIAARGVKGPILVEMSGIGRSTINRIVNRQTKTKGVKPTVIELCSKKPLIAFGHSFHVHSTVLIAPAPTPGVELEEKHREDKTD